MINYKDMVIDQFKNQNISQVLIVDDAYDSLEIEEANLEDLHEILESRIRDFVSESELSDESLMAIKNEVESVIDKSKSKVSNEIKNEINKIFDLLWKEFYSDENPDWDISNRFTLRKEKLNELEPIYKFLEMCGTKPKTTGLKDVQDVLNDFDPDIIFMDFRMSPPDTTTSDDSADMISSTELLSEILRKNIDHMPIIIMMSRDDIESRLGQYYEELGDRIMPLRIGSIEKKWIKFINSTDDIEILLKAAEVLIESLGSFKFCNLLEWMLGQWKKGVENTVDELVNELKNLDKNDFTYLLKYSLYDEGEKFSTYLGSFLGDSLRSLLEKIDYEDSEKVKLLNEFDVNSLITKEIPEPRNKLAELYNHIRISHPENKTRIRQGDLFLTEDNKQIRAVMTPDCDIIVRGDGRSKTSEIYTVGGTVKGVEGGATPADELIIIKGEIKSIKWNLKDLMTHDKSEMDSISYNNGKLKYFGTLNPLIAQNLQKRFLSDMSRVGIATPPIIYDTTKVKTFIRTAKENNCMEFLDIPNSNVTVSLARGNNGLHLVRFNYFYVLNLVDILSNYDQTKMLEIDKNNLMEIIGEKKEKFIQLLQKTGITKDVDTYGIKLLNRKTNNYWLQFEVKYDRIF